MYSVHRQVMSIVHTGVHCILEGIMIQPVRYVQCTHTGNVNSPHLCTLIVYLEE